MHHALPKFQALHFIFNLKLGHVSSIFFFLNINNNNNNKLVNPNNNFFVGHAETFAMSMLLSKSSNSYFNILSADKTHRNTRKLNNNI